MANFAFIDGQNLHITIKNLGWEIDYSKFRIYLQDKYNVKKAFYFIGFKRENIKMYKNLERKGFSVIFKESTLLPDGTAKGNCDAELVLHAVSQINRYDKAVIIAGDGDYACLIKYLLRKKKIEKILVPDINTFSFLIRKATKADFAKLVTGVNQLKNKIQFIKV
jgi:uncharacterized LabA/DUF88 family protein